MMRLRFCRMSSKAKARSMHWSLESRSLRLRWTSDSDRLRSWVRYWLQNESGSTPSDLAFCTNNRISDKSVEKYFTTGSVSDLTSRTARKFLQRSYTFMSDWNFCSTVLEELFSLVNAKFMLLRPYTCSHHATWKKLSTLKPGICCRRLLIFSINWFVFCRYTSSAILFSMYDTSTKLSSLTCT